jgi:hypothetical protein
MFKRRLTRVLEVPFEHVHEDTFPEANMRDLQNRCSGLLKYAEE